MMGTTSNLSLARSLIGLSLCLASLHAYSASAPRNQDAGVVTATVTVNPKKVLGKTNRLLLGNNAIGYFQGTADYSAKGAGLWDPESRIPMPDMLGLAKGAGVSSLRWPGGCGAHLFNWKQTVGPLETRPKQAFGLAEFMQVAEQLGAEPVITIADYWGTEQDAADLVEYLNAPVGRNSNGGIDWAAVRAKQGHPEPYKVKWFEFGNETDHGTHALNAPTNGVPMSPVEYASRFREYSVAMKAVDPRVKLGAVIAMDTFFPLSHWSETVIKQTGGIADFLIYHAYLPRYFDNSGAMPAQNLFEVAFGAADQLDVFLRRLKVETKRLTGREIPVGITEFNGQFVQEQPSPYRLSIGNAVLVADMVFTFMKPANGIAFANYWQFSNEYWGTVRGYGPGYTKRPAYHVFQMFNQFLGDSLIETQVKSGGYQNKGGYGVLATNVTPTEFQMRPIEGFVPSWKHSSALGAQASVDNTNQLSVELSGAMDINYHHSAARLSVSPNFGYRVSGEIRVDGLQKTGARLEVTDGRGWNATKSTVFSKTVRGKGWTRVEVDYIALSDASSVDIRLRRTGGVVDGGRMYLRNVKVASFVPDRQGEVAYVSALATEKRGTMSVFLVNRNIQSPVKVQIEGISGGQMSGISLHGPSVQSNNEISDNVVVPRPLSVVKESSSGTVVLPPHSFSVITVDR